METERLDIYTRFLTPTGVSLRRQKTIETTDIMLQMVASGRGVAALPRWLVEAQADSFDVAAVRLGRRGMAKQIFVGLRDGDAEIDYLRAFVNLARGRRDRACAGFSSFRLPSSPCVRFLTPAWQGPQHYSRQ